MPSAHGLGASKEALPSERGREHRQQHGSNGGQTSRQLFLDQDAARLADSSRAVASGNLQASVVGQHSSHYLIENIQNTQH